MQPGTSDSSESVSYTSLLKIPGILLMALVLMMALATPLMIDPILAPHLHSYGLSVSVIGVAFLLRALFIAILSPFIGKIYAKFTYKLPVMVFGLV